MASALGGKWIRWRERGVQVRGDSGEITGMDRKTTRMIVNIFCPSVHFLHSQNRTHLSLRFRLWQFHFDFILCRTDIFFLPSQRDMHFGCRVAGTSCIHISIIFWHICIRDYKRVDLFISDFYFINKNHIYWVSLEIAAFNIFYPRTYEVGCWKVIKSIRFPIQYFNVLSLYYWFREVRRLENLSASLCVYIRMYVCLWRHKNTTG